MWRRLRRAIGYWIAGAEPAIVHCASCGRITTAYCTMHRDQLLHPTRELPQVAR